MAVTLVEIKKIIKDLFTNNNVETEAALKQQESNFISIVSANTKILNERLDKVENNILENAKKVATLATEVEEIKIQNNNFDLKKFNSKLREIEDRTKKNNLRVDGIKENDNETWLESEQKVKEIFNEYLGVENVKIERAHRAGKKGVKENRIIVLKLLGFKNKEEILRNASKLKGKNIYINEDYCIETNEIRKELREKMKIERKLGKFA
ncbi:uncharacterized protein LOC136080400 [Hydra vulgaris]|uniref:Uncharacterized protein LOC136080400 n=1 Tax=Hydra vulgaris TaxID=6087 RepID=A0ABM4BV64_HYDVU